MNKWTNQPTNKHDRSQYILARVINKSNDVTTTNAEAVATSKAVGFLKVKEI